MTIAFAPASAKSLPLYFVTRENWEASAGELGGSALAFARASGFEGQAGKLLLAPDAKGGISGALFGLDPLTSARRDPFQAGALANLLPKGVWRFANAPDGGKDALELAALAFLLGSYKFGRYKKVPADGPRLVAPAGIDAKAVGRIAEALCLARDLINTPANDMGPDALEGAVTQLAKRFGVKPKIIKGDALLKQNFPLIHAVGRAAETPPRLVDFSWGPAKAPKVTLVGKGVCFDTGGLDIKPSSAMLLMKKDMGGAAAALALAQMIMDAGLKVRLRVLIPIVENSVSGSSFRPGDI